MEPLERLQSFDQFKTLSDARRLSILKQLMMGPATLSQLGRTFGEHPAWIRHHLKQLEQAGLVELYDIKVSERYIEKYYRAKAHAFLFQKLLLPERPGRRMVVLSGSHDLALEMLSQSPCGNLDIFTLPVGSLDGLVALRQDMCIAAGCHLYDTGSGDYNSPYVRHFFPDKKMVLLTLAYREQGLIIEPGNPHKIQDLEDLTRQDIRFINRNQGSGTRLWLDEQLHKIDISPQQVMGYFQEAHTHTEVARAIQQGLANVGLGIRAAAVANNLDFIPLFKERYDLVMAEERIEDQQLAPMFDTLYSGEFRREIEGLGGYDVTHLGKLIIL